MTVVVSETNPHGMMPEVVAVLGQDSEEILTRVFDKAGIELYTDVSFGGTSNEQVDDLEAYVRACCVTLETEFRVPDIRCAGEGALAFGKWKGFLASLVRSQPPVPGRYALDGVRESEIRQVVVEALIPLCTVVVRGRS